MKKVLTIAGSDCSGGAGIQADLKTMMGHGVYGMSVITAVTAQNTLGVTGICNLEPDIIQKQLDAVFTDIFPDAVKIGMVSEKETIYTICDALRKYHPNNVVLDPVMVSTSGHSLLQEDAISALTTELIPLCSLITPNLPEAEMLLQTGITSKDDMKSAGRDLCERFHTNVLLKGGHLKDTADDLLILQNTFTFHWYHKERVDTNNTHGTGCTLSSAIASNLARGMELEQAVEEAKEYVYQALKKGLNLGTGNGPLKHFTIVV